MKDKVRMKGNFNLNQFMNKESIIAIVFGLALGVVVAIGAVFYTVQKQKVINSPGTSSKTDATNSGALKPITVPPTVTVLQSLEIEKPQSGIVTQEKIVKVSGRSGKNVLLVFQSPIKTIAKESENGSFEVDFPLALGENTITVSAYYASVPVPVQKKIYIYRIIPQ